MTPVPDILRRIEKYRPAHKPYRAAKEEMIGAALRTYGDELCGYLAQQKEMTVHESYYIHYLETCLSRDGHTEVAEKLKGTAWRCRVVGAPRGTTTSTSVQIPGLEGIIRANWRFLPDPESMSPQELLAALRDHLTEQANHTSFQFDLKRIEFALTLKNRTNIAVGTDEFYGYYAFLFPRDVVLFECPAHGNAAFVTRGDWQELSQLYKAQLEGKARRVIHRRFWRHDIQGALDRLLRT